MEQRFLASLIVLTIYFFISCRASQFDPYETLGVRRHSSADEIRKTYKKLAREWSVRCLSLRYTYNDNINITITVQYNAIICNKSNHNINYYDLSITYYFLLPSHSDYQM